MTRLGPTCAICGEAIWDVNEIVCPAAEPWRLLGHKPGDIAHRGCANTAVAEADEGARSDEGDWQAIQEEVWDAE